MLCKIMNSIPLTAIINYYCILKFVLWRLIRQSSEQRRSRLVISDSNTVQYLAQLNDHLNSLEWSAKYYFLFHNNHNPKFRAWSQSFVIIERTFRGSFGRCWRSNSIIRVYFENLIGSVNHTVKNLQVYFQSTLTTFRIYQIYLIVSYWAVI